MINLKEQHSKFVKLYSFSSGATSPTNIRLVEEMISHLDESIFKNPNSKFLDPCAGTGTFGIVLYDKLLKYHDSKWVLENMIFVVDISRVNCDLLKKLGFVNVYNDDFLKLKLDMKFDVIVGNPPFQDEYGSGNSLWSKFIKKSNDILNHNGYCSLIVPGRWVLPGENIKKDKIRIWDDIFAKYNMIYINIGECGKYFKNVGSDSDYFSYFIYSKNEYSGITKILTNYSEFEFNFNKTKWLPYKNPNKLSINIINKVEKKKNDIFDVKWKFELRDVSFSELFTSKVFIGNTKDGIPNFKYSNEASTLHSNKKVLFKMGRFLNYNQRIYIDYIGDVSYNSAYVCLLNDLENVDYLNSKLYKFIGNCLFNGSEITSSGWKTLPRLNTTKKWSDVELYEYFNLTQEEIDYIENYVE